MTKGGEKNLWDIAVQQAGLTGDNEEKPQEEKSILFIGSKNAGKTSIIFRFLERDEPPKPTVSLEYTFGRRAKGHNIAKDVGHIWELGGGTWHSKLIDVPINADFLLGLSVVIVLDLSKPGELWFTLEKLLSAMKARVEYVISEIKRNDPSVKDKLKKSMWERLGEGDHTDKDMINPFPIPLVIIGSKYDVFQDFDSEKRKVMCKVLRFVAHSHGAHLQFFSTRQEGLTTRARALISHLLFGTSGSKNIQIDHNKPLLVPFGTDSFQQIGSPPLPEGDLGRVTAKNPMELWKIAYSGYFPAENISDPSLVEDPAKDVQYKETSIDGMRLQKDEELERYRKLSERREKEAQQRLIAEGLA